MNNCVICNRAVNEDEAAVLEIGAYGNPKYLCEECSSELDIATGDRDPEKIFYAIDRIAKKVSDGGMSDRTFATINSILESAAKRAKEINDGTYDFSLDESEDDESFDEIPEELRETEEDRELDRQDEENAEKFNRIFDYVSFGAFLGIALFIVWKVIDTFLI